MESYYQKENPSREKHPKTKDIYIPDWARTLIDLYTSSLKYEVMY